MIKIQDFSISKLILLDDLDFTDAISLYNFTVGDYFYLLSEFASNATQYLASLNSIAAFKGTEDDMQNLLNMHSIFKKIGFTDVTSSIKEILTAFKHKDMAHIFSCSDRVIESVTRFFTRLLSAEAVKKEVLHSVPLKEAIEKATEQLFKEENERKMRILAVDDMQFMLDTIANTLDGEYEVYKLTDPTLLEAALHHVTPELFLLDYDMPYLNGFELVPIIRSYSEHENTPIIFVTSIDRAANIAAAIKLGACEYILKPFQADLLTEKVAQHIKRKNRFAAAFSVASETEEEI
ncbi:MAG: response regulator [Oscillospiraceae bacterium]|nr:response regulator [Oscillospiraceae bacterium]